MTTTAPATPVSAQSPGYVSVKEYLQMSDFEPDVEYVDGAIEERAVGEFDHADWQGAVFQWFRSHEKWNIRVVPEQRVQVAATRYRVPDVTVLDRRLAKEQIITQPPLAVFEILSPQDTVKKVLAKLGDYQAMGIPQIWVIQPEGASFFRYLGGSLQLAENFDAAPAHEIQFNMNEIKALLQE